MKKVKKFIRGMKKFVKKRWLLLLPIVFFLLTFYLLILKDLPSPTRLHTSSRPQSSQIYDRNGILLYTIYSTRNQIFVPLSQIPDSLKHATIVAEDKDFYKHGAVDFKGMARALYSTIFKKNLQGGSTLTQQLVKNSLLTPERTITRKAKEIFLSFITEMLYTKNQILEMYLNQVPYGGTAYGVEAASQRYFGKSVKNLSIAESSLLAGLPESPSTYSPFASRPDLGLQRQQIILKRLYDQKYISKAKFDKNRSLELVLQKISDQILAPHFVLYIKEFLERKYGEKTVEEGGLKVITSLDLSIQNMAQDTVASEVAKLKRYHVTNGASLITKPGTGEILAMVGSIGYFETSTDGNVNIALAHLQPGSSIKPINYATGLSKGFTAATLFIDQPICFPGNPSYCPKNYDGKFRGPVLLRNALGNSLNIPAVEMLKLNGIESMISTASAMGIKTFTEPDRYGLSLTLGGGEVTMVDMATAFGVFANKGYRIDLHPILKVTDKTGHTLEEYTVPKSPIFGKQVLPGGVAFIISHILQDNGARTDAFGPNSALKVGNFPVAVKTGTTNDYRDNWTIGYTPSILVTTWVGNNDHTAMSGIVSGVTGAAPIWHKIMENLLQGTKPEPPQQPIDVISRQVCNDSGFIPLPEGSPDRCGVKSEFFIKGHEPTQVQPGRGKVFVDKATGDIPKPEQTDNLEEKDEVVITDPLGNRYCLTCPHSQPSPSPTP